MSEKKICLYLCTVFSKFLTMRSYDVTCHRKICEISEGNTKKSAMYYRMNVGTNITVLLFLLYTYEVTQTLQNCTPFVYKQCERNQNKMFTIILYKTTWPWKRLKCPAHLNFVYCPS